MSTLADLVLEHPASAHGRKYAYGTAGFRYAARILDGVALRVGMLAALRSEACGGRAVGVMVTASHNPVHDNGVKVVDPTGEMLHESWEAAATALANADTPHDVQAAVKHVRDTLCAVDGAAPPGAGVVLIGRDTRPSGEHLCALVAAGARAVGATAHVCGEPVTTPEMHVRVVRYNDAPPAALDDAWDRAEAAAWVASLCDAYVALVAAAGGDGDGGAAPPTVAVDAAHGVGGPRLAAVAAELERRGAAHVRVLNAGRAELLNDACGAEFVHKEARYPRDLTADVVRAAGAAASVDGDADRVVFLVPPPAATGADAADDRAPRVLDGDNMAVLLAHYVAHVLPPAEQRRRGITVGLVHTAYSNGAAVEYARRVLGMHTACVPTGVKHLHAKAHDYDIGVYFEPNGHGTVRVAPRVLGLAAAAAGDHDDALRPLRALAALCNQHTGCAIGDMLAVVGVLRALRWTAGEQWAAMYTPRCSCLRKVEVADRSAVRTTHDELRVVHPAALQDDADAVIAEYAEARAFVRPSGTEDAVRVYAEAASQQDADALAERLCEIVRKHLCHA